ncbi:MAG: calcium-translocating P-type ATPase, PMCA-type [Synergistaceae bacterium]|jgi:calcium-translocating P-type ATPase|nr:calcium-translocating P-type ATPase, PMCA-type [Synergistaceae bacterium]
MMENFGLSGAQVEESRAKHGDNRLTEVEGEGFWRKLLNNFGDPMIKILCVALVINVIFAFMGQTEWYESAGIAVAVALATFVSTYSEYRNENAFQRLQEEASKIKCKTYRDGRIADISIDDIVVGDCVLLQAGDKIPADGAIVDGEIKADQSALNGESHEARKSPAPSGVLEDDGAPMDFLNPHKVFRGSVVCGGNAVMRVRSVGDRTVYGEIASELQAEDDRDSPLKVKLGHLARAISKFGYIGGATIAIAFLFQRIVIGSSFDLAQMTLYCSNWLQLLDDVVRAVMLAVIIIVMAVPEGLPLMIALVSALNMGKMLKDNVLVRKIIGIETAGSLNILFSDKTGTITKGQLEAVTFVDGRGAAYSAPTDVREGLRRILSLCIARNTNAVISRDEKGMSVIGGNATERAVLAYGAPIFTDADVTVTKSIPFNSDNKYSASSVSGEYKLTLIKGAPEKIIARCGGCYDADGNRVPLSLDKVELAINDLASRAIRVLAFAVSDAEIEGESLPEGGWTLVGIMGIRDEVRPESIGAIREVQSAGIQVVMITGDRRDTAIAIASEAGILKGGDDMVLTSDELAAMSDDEVKRGLGRIKVVARALPSDKSRLVRLAQDLNLVAGMTGDGVNDSPALKKADVGFAMGGGTEVAKEASDIVILDNNFASIDKAILYGRTIFNSIRKFIIFQLSINVSAVLISFAAPLLGMPNPLSITQILWVNLVMDTLAALAFGGEPALARFMREHPKRREESIVSRYMWSAIGTASLWTSAVGMFILLSPVARGWFRPDEGNRYLLTGFFAFFIIMAVFNAFNARTERLNLLDNIGRNKGFWRVITLIVVIQVAMTYLGGAVLGCYGLTLREWAVVLACSFSIIPVDLARKFFINTDLKA